jgi:type 1 fimbriae regulatory protein FimB/type 1 fimbriae regulatory protein FimE
MRVAKRRGRNGPRDATMILLAYRHGLRVTELCSLRWDQVDLSAAQLHVKRLKGGTSGVHPLWGAELRALRELKRGAVLPYGFLTERGTPVSTAGFRKTLARISQASSIPFAVHPHMLRHACGFKLANDGQDTRVIQQYLGHRNIQNTVRYTELASTRFNSLWDD